MSKKKKNPAAVTLGRMGGLARARKLTPEQIRDICRKAGRASALKRRIRKTA